MKRCVKWQTPALVLGLALGPAALAGNVQVIHSEIPGSPTSALVGALDPSGNPVSGEYTSMLKLEVRDDGNRWMLRTLTSLPDDSSHVLLLGRGRSSSILAQEGQPIPTGAAGELYDFFTDALDFGSGEQLVFMARARGGDNSIFQKAMLFDGSSLSIVHHMGELLTGLSDRPPDPSGDETFGNSLGSAHLLDDGRIGFLDPTIDNIHSFRRPALFYDTVAFRQSGVSAIGAETWDSFSSNTFTTTPDGLHWAVLGDTENADTSIDNVLAVDDQVQLQEGTTVLAGSIQPDPVDDIFAYQLLSDGVWMARGDYDDGTTTAADFAVRNGVLLAETGLPLVPDSTENWSNSFGTLIGNEHGDWLLIGNTDNPDVNLDSAAVLNGERVVMREGDPIDLNGDGVFDEGLFLRGFNANNAHLSNALVLMVIGTLRDAGGTNLGDALLRVRLSCDGDADGSGAVDLSDLATLLANFGADESSPAFNVGVDFNLDGVIDLGDLATLLANFGATCP